MTLELGVYSFGNTPRTPDGGYGATAQAIRDVLEAAQLADEVGLDFFGFGEHHTRSMPLSSPTALVNAAAASTHDIKLGTTVTVLSTDETDPSLRTARHRRVDRARPHRPGRRTRLVTDHVPDL